MVEDGGHTVPFIGGEETGLKISHLFGEIVVLG